MADFNAIHKDLLIEARRALESRAAGESWLISLREPIKAFPDQIDAAFSFIRVKLDQSKNLCPADQASMVILRDWKIKFKDTPDGAFIFKDDL